MTALVTGGSSGIGEAVVRRLAGAGQRVVIASLDAPASERLRDELRQAGGEVDSIEIDLSDRSAVKALAHDLGPVDVLINNAAPTQVSVSLLEVSEADWAHQQEVIMWAPLLLIQGLGKAMAAAGGGAIVNVSSPAAQRPSPLVAAYAAAKAALEVITKAAALELGPSGVRCNAVAPSFIPTNRNRAVWDNKDEAELGGDTNPLGRLCAPDDVARVIVWLASEEAGFVNGQVITVDGGMSAGMRFSRSR